MKIKKRCSGCNKKFITIKMGFRDRNGKMMYWGGSDMCKKCDDKLERELIMKEII